MCMAYLYMVGVSGMNEWLHFFLRHQFVNNELIVKCGLIDKRKVGLHIKDGVSQITAFHRLINNF